MVPAARFDREPAPLDQLPFSPPPMDTPNITSKIMENKIAAFTFFTFLFFIVSAARLAVDPSAVHGEHASKLTKTSHRSAAAMAGSNILLPGEKPNSDLDQNTANNHLPESEKTTNDLSPHANFSRFHPINRHFHGKVPPRGQKPVAKPLRTCKHPMPPHKNPRIETSGENDDIVQDRMNLHPKASRGDFQSNWFKVKHHYAPRRHHNNNRNDNVINTKQVLDREKVKSSVRQQLQKKREEEAGFMKSIRKFLKHTFD